MSAVSMMKQHLVTKHSALIQHIGPIKLPVLCMLLCQIKSNQKEGKLKQLDEQIRDIDLNCFETPMQHNISKLVFLV